MKVTPQELMERQSWTLDQKIDHSLGAIEQFYNHVGGKVYVSFSGGKDSTVLLHLVRRLYPNATAMCVLTGNDWPEVVKFVRGFDNVLFSRPKMTFKNVCSKYGFPLVSKETAMYINDVRHTGSAKLRELRLNGRGTKKNGKVPERWKFLIDAEFDVTHKCCNILKKEPARRFEKKTGLRPIIGTMVGESSLRRQKYMNTSCNVLEGSASASYPMSIWNESDVWDYIRRFNLDYCELYDMGHERTGCMVCGFGAAFDNRFSVLKQQKPKAYSVFMSYKNNGVRLDDAIIFAGLMR